MRFISHIRRYAVGVLQAQIEYLPGGGTRELAPMLNAQFVQGDLTAEELQFAERKWDKESHGRTLEQDQVTKTPLIGRLSMFDTDSDANQLLFDTVDRALSGQEHVKLPRGQRWRDGDAERITTETLLHRAKTSDAFALFEEAPIAAPWPAFNEFPGNAEDLLEVLVAQGHHLPQALAYEKQNLKRPDVIGILEDAVERSQPVPAEVIR